MARDEDDSRRGTAPPLSVHCSAPLGALLLSALSRLRTRSAPAQCPALSCSLVAGSAFWPPSSPRRPPPSRRPPSRRRPGCGVTPYLFPVAAASRSETAAAASTSPRGIVPRWPTGSPPPWAATTPPMPAGQRSLPPRTCSCLGLLAQWQSGTWRAGSRWRCMPIPPGSTPSAAALTWKRTTVQHGLTLPPSRRPAGWKRTPALCTCFFHARPALRLQTTILRPPFPWPGQTAGAVGRRRPGYRPSSCRSSTRAAVPSATRSKIHGASGSSR